MSKEEPYVKAFLRQAKTFKALGKAVGKQESFKAKLDAAIAYGLAEVCEELAKFAEEAK